MFQFLKNLYNKLFLDGLSPLRMFDLARSGRWRKVREDHLLVQPVCQVCGGKYKLNVHHIVPVHIDGTRELDPTNLITLCEGHLNCHLLFGHLQDWHSYNVNVIDDVKIWASKLAQRP